MTSGRLLTTGYGGGLSVQRLAFTPDDRTLAAQGYGDVWLWDVREGLDQPRLYLQGDGNSQTYDAMALSPDGALLALGAPGGDLQLYDMASARLLKSFHAHAVRVADLIFSADGRLLISAGNDNSVRFWGLGDFQPKADHAAESALPAPILTPTAPYTP